jgi:hypothetical protein
MADVKASRHDYTYKKEDVERFEKNAKNKLSLPSKRVIYTGHQTILAAVIQAVGSGHCNTVC